MKGRPLSSLTYALMSLSAAVAATDTQPNAIDSLDRLRSRANRQSPLHDQAEISARQRKRQAKLARRAARAAMAAAPAEKPAPGPAPDFQKWSPLLCECRGYGPTCTYCRGYGVR